MRNKTDVMELQELLHFFKAAGVEDAVNDMPVDAFTAAEKAKKQSEMRQAAISAANPAPRRPPAEQEAAQTPSSQEQSGIARPKPPEDHAGGPAGHDDWLAYAKAQARGAQNLEELKARIAAFNGCNLKFTAKTTCIADGTAPHALMFIGEGPGAEEDRQALPFVGRAGQLLNLMLAAIGYSRESLQKSAARGGDSEIAAAEPKIAYITNAVFWRPPGNRTPTSQEIALCRPFLERQIELVRPQIIVSLGGVAAAALLGRPQSILRLRGQWRNYKTADGREIPYMPSLHPAFLLRSPSQKKVAWQDFLAAKMRLEAPGAA